MGIEGLKAKVGYVEVSDKAIAGQILSVELSISDSNRKECLHVCI